MFFVKGLGFRNLIVELKNKNSDSGDEKFPDLWPDKETSRNQTQNGTRFFFKETPDS